MQVFENFLFGTPTCPTIYGLPRLWLLLLLSSLLPLRGFRLVNNNFFPLAAHILRFGILSLVFPFAPNLKALSQFSGAFLIYSSLHRQPKVVAGVLLLSSHNHTFPC